MKYLIEKVSGYFPLYTTLFLSLKSQTFIQAMLPLNVFLIPITITIKQQRIMKINRTWGHTELARLYFPGIQPKSASAQLARWIRLDEDLFVELTKAGYKKGQRMYSPRQVAILVDHLGEPETREIR